MKTKTINLKTIVSLVLLMIAVFGAVNISYSYFSSSTSKSGQVSMGDLNVAFIYQAETSIPNTVTTSVTLSAATETIDRGVAFGLKIWNAQKNSFLEISYLQISNGSTSTDCYVRFWIEAYVIKSGVADTSIDYGKYFALTRPSTLPSANNFTRATSEPYCYYVEKSLVGGEYISLGKELTLQDISASDPVPTKLLGEELQIRISFEAVQKANEAFKSVFKVTATDKKGYYSGWV